MLADRGRAGQPTRGARTHADDVLHRLDQSEVGERRGNAIDLAFGYAQVAADHLERLARQPAQGILDLVQGRQQIRPPPRILPNPHGEIGVAVHGSMVCQHFTHNSA